MHADGVKAALDFNYATPPQSFRDHIRTQIVTASNDISLQHKDKGYATKKETVSKTWKPVTNQHGGYTQAPNGLLTVDFGHDGDVEGFFVTQTQERVRSGTKIMFAK